MHIKYYIGVKTPAGWRQVSIVATATPISAAMCKVDTVELIDGEIPHHGQSRTGAKRQQFDGRYFAQAQIGSKKRLSTCQILETA